jgi:hypothetical protein
LPTLLFDKDGTVQLLVPALATLLQGDVDALECASPIPDPSKRAATTNSWYSKVGLSKCFFINHSPFILFMIFIKLIYIFFITTIID